MKAIHLLALGVAIILATISSSAEAGGEASTGRYIAEGPIFDLPPDMSVDRQEIRVTLHSIRLIYVFRASRRRIVHFRFDLPAMPVDADPDAIDLDGQDAAAGRGADRQPLNYLNLSVHVNGTPVALSGRARALHEGKDVTRQLREAGVPLLYVLDTISPWRQLPPRTQTMLEASGLLVIDAAQWRYQASFEWEQAFEPGETRVEISYVPVADYWNDINSTQFPEIARDGSATRTYCIDNAVRRAYFHRPAYDLYKVAHRTPSPGGWRGPVGRYRLVVDKDAGADMVAFCPLAATKTSSTTFEWTAEDFTPGRGIDVLFFVASDEGPSRARN